MSDKEILVQLALGTFDKSLLKLVWSTENPAILTAAAKMFAKWCNEGPITRLSANMIIDAFMSNERTPSLVKSYIKLVQRIHTELSYEHFPIPIPKNVLTKRVFEKLHSQLFDD